MMGLGSTYLIAVWITAAWHHRTVESLGKVTINFLNYTNSVGQVSRPGIGQGCCDNPTGNIASCDIDACDPVFDICIESIGSRVPCDFFQQTTMTFSNQHEVIFGKTPFTNGITNPISFPIPNWDGSIFINITVQDGDNAPIKMTTFIKSFTLSTPSQNGIVNWHSFEMKATDGIRLQAEVDVQCDPGFRDKYCYCEDRDTLKEHTMCDRDAKRVCLPGWAEPPGLPGPIKCLTSTLPCVTKNPCQNGATCGTYNQGSGDVIVCSCLPDYTGQNCENYITTSAVPTTSTTTVSTKTLPPAPANNIVSVAPSTLASATSRIVKKFTTSIPPSSGLKKTTSGGWNLLPGTVIGKSGTTKDTKTTISGTVQTVTTPDVGKQANSQYKSSNNTQSDSGDDNTGAIAGGVAAAGLLGLISFLLIIFRKKIFKRQQAEVSDVQKDSVETLDVKETDTTVEGNSPPDQSVGTQGNDTATKP